MRGERGDALSGPRSVPRMGYSVSMPAVMRGSIFVKQLSIVRYLAANESVVQRAMIRCMPLQFNPPTTRAHVETRSLSFPVHNSFLYGRFRALTVIVTKSILKANILSLDQTIPLTLAHIRPKV